MTVECRGCGAQVAVVATGDDGLLRGVSHCPHCGLMRPIPDDRQAVFAQWYGLVKQAVGRMARAGMDADDAETVALEAYARAVLQWEPSRAKFATVATHYLRSASGRAIAAFKARPKGVNTSQSPVFDAYHGFEHAHPDDLARDGSTPAPDAAAEAEDERERVRRAVAKLPEREAYVVARRHGFIDGEPATLAVVAEELGLSKERVRQIEAAALVKLRSILTQPSE